MTTLVIRGARAFLLSHAAVLQVFAATIFLSAFLLFSVQPVFAKMVLPKLGGSPSVWAVSMCFFQAVLLAGYCYAHALNRYAPGRQGAMIHLALMALAILALPFGLPANAAPPAGDAYLWLIATLAAGVGIPFFMVSANAPLLQSWFARSGHPHAADPYFLYGASNFGSLLALLSYPVLIEPNLGLSAQAGVWTTGFVMLAALIAMSAIAALVLPANADAATPVAQARQLAPLSARQRAKWVALAFVPSGLLTAFTTHLTTDIASAPFLWVLPLAAFLATFIVVFRDEPLVPDHYIANTMAPLVVMALLALTMPPSEGNLSMVAFSALAFLVVTLHCHRELYKRRPDAGHLTEFYLWMSLGGVLGGMFASLLAPQIFNTVLEYPLLYIAAMACQPGLWQRPDAAQARAFGRLAVAAGAVVTTAALLAAAYPGITEHILKLTIMAAAVGAAVWRLDARRSALMCIAAFACLMTISKGIVPLSSERSFFGVVHVAPDGEGRFRAMLHGTTLHGAERVLADDGSKVTHPQPITYYHASAPLARGIELARAATGRDGASFSVGVVGLGVGAMACHARANEHWRFYEIDPLVVKVASNPKNFTYLSRCPPSDGIIVGDARLTLEAESKARFDYLVIDAFSSDAVPVHLMTREAIAMYLDLLKPSGVLSLHVSSRFMDLPNVGSITAGSLPGVHVAVVETRFALSSLDVMNSKVVFVSRSEGAIKKALALPGARLPMALPITPWSDDYSDVMGAIWRHLRR
jgi:hypothetical protein